MSAQHAEKCSFCVEFLTKVIIAEAPSNKHRKLFRVLETTLVDESRAESLKKCLVTK